MASTQSSSASRPWKTMPGVAGAGSADMAPPGEDVVGFHSCAWRPGPTGLAAEKIARSFPREKIVDALLVGRQIRARRRAAGLTLDDLGAKAGVAPSRLSLFENGRREPRLSQLVAIASALGAEVPALLADEAPGRAHRARGGARPVPARAALRGPRAARRAGHPHAAAGRARGAGRPAPGAAPPCGAGDRDAGGGAPGEHRRCGSPAVRGTTTSPRSSRRRRACSPSSATSAGR